MGILSLEFLWNFASSFGTKNLLTANPSIVVYQIEPALDYIESNIEIKICDGEEVESFIPKEPSWEKWPRRYSREKLKWPLKLLLFLCSGSCCFLPETLILLIVLWSIGPINNFVSMEVPKPTIQIRKHVASEP